MSLEAKDQLRGETGHHPRAKYVAPIPAGTAFITSMVKSGRTWLRFMLANYLARVYRLDLAVDLHSQYAIIPDHDAADDERIGVRAFAFAEVVDLPRIRCDHRIWAPFDPARNPTVVLVRSPVDVTVSAYFMETRLAGRVDHSLSAYIRGKHGIGRWINYHNELGRARAQPGVLWISYERMAVDPAGALAQVAGRFGVPESAAAIGESVAVAAFERMQSLELRAGGYPRKRRAAEPRNPLDPAALRMRQGRVGAGAARLSPRDLDYCRIALEAELDAAVRRRLADLDVRFP